MVSSHSTSSREPSLPAPHELLALGLGCNQGRLHRQLEMALHELKELLGPLWVAPLYRSAAISDIPQDDYLNTVAIARLPTAGPVPRLSPRESRELQVRRLLMRLKELESRAGREPDGPRDSPRPLDLDILLWGQDVFELPDQSRQNTAPHDRPRSAAGSAWSGAIEIPHPRLRQRRFVLAPLCDLLPALPLPPDGASAEQALAALGTAQDVERWHIPSAADA